jgi:hypothetical protein
MPDQKQPHRLRHGARKGQLDAPLSSFMENDKEKEQARK